MKVDLSDAEKNFGSFNAGLTTFVMNTFGAYEEQLKLFVKANNELKEKIAALEKELKESKHEV